MGTASMGRKTISSTTLLLSSPQDEPTAQSTLYTEFADDIEWIVDRVRHDYSTLPPSVKKVAKYYLTERVRALPLSTQVGRPHPLVARPVPFIVFWFSKALGLECRETQRNLALSFLYACLSVCPNDDLLDRRAFAARHQLYLAHWFWDRYYRVFDNLFPSKSPIWHILADCTAAWRRSDQRSLVPKDMSGTAALSPRYLSMTSEYLRALMFPTLAAVALLSGKAHHLTPLRRFAWNYCIGFRIVDDLRDWRDDYAKRNRSQSCVINLLLSKLKRGLRASQETLTCILTDDLVTSEIYACIEKFYLRARREAEKLGAVYVERFVDEQLLGHQRELARMAQAKRFLTEAVAIALTE
jgi:hypothetical protein